MKQAVLVLSALILVCGCMPEKAQRRDQQDPTTYWDFTYNGVPGKLVGKKWVWWHGNGKKSREIGFVEGDSIIVVKQWYSSGKMSSESRRGVSGDASLREVAKTWYEDGKIESQSWYVKKDSLEMKTEWYKNGVKKCEGGFRQRYGTMREWEASHQGFAASTDRSSEESEEQGKQVLISLKHGRWTGWTDKGKKEYEGRYVNGKKQGPWTEWEANGVRRQGLYDLGQRKGRWTTWYANGRKQEEDGYEGFTRHGSSSAWHPNGQKAHEGAYQMGQRDGKWIMWTERGKKKEESRYSNGERNGDWKTWYDNGGAQEQGSYAAGMKNGEWIEWHKNGRKKEKGRFEKGKREGLWTFWSEDGERTESGSYVNGEREGRWAEVGKYERAEGEYRLGRRIGRWLIQHGNREPDMEIAYAFEDNSGTSVGTYENGQKSYEGECAGGTRIGPWTEWYEDGQTKLKGSYDAGKRMGMWTDWHKNGQKKSEGAYTEGLRVGPWTEWYENGKPRWKGGFASGVRSGHWVGYYDSGEKEWEGDYSTEGNAVLLFEWTRNGDPTGKGWRDADGGKMGEWLEWYPDGSRGEGGYVNNEKQGKWLVYGLDGQLIRTEEWKKGRRVEGTLRNQQKK